MEKIPIEKTIFIGIGNEFRTDDGVGIYIVRQLIKYDFPKENILELPGEGSELMEAWKDAEQVCIFDAVSSGAEPGTIFELDANRQEIPFNFFNYSTHNFSLAEAVELSRVLNQLPPSLKIFGVEGKNFSDGNQLSAVVKASAERILQSISITDNLRDKFNPDYAKASSGKEEPFLNVHKTQRS